MLCHVKLDIGRQQHAKALPGEQHAGVLGNEVHPELLSGEQQAGAHKRARPDACASLYAGLVTLSVGLVMGALVGLLLLLLRRQLGHAFTDDPAVLAVSRLP